MKELEQILRTHARQYPQMRPTDAVKLIYQNEFGGGHMIRNEDACMEYLRREYGAVEKDPSMPQYEPIGNGLVRVNLAAVRESEVEQLGRDFIRSAAGHTGSLESFRKKLAVLAALVEEGLFSFGTDALNAYLTKYEAAGYPAVSHSREYRESYRPAYRVIQK